VLLDQGHEEIVDDRMNACGLQGLQAHEQIVAHQVERHGEHCGGDVLKIDLAAVVGAPVNDLGA
jgi:hypothetical protein